MKCFPRCRCGRHNRPKQQIRVHLRTPVAERKATREDFDMERAITGFKRILKEVYG